ncbi:MAG: IPTL-CTERM sorting domain-containing protein [Proteobacteria bacterium]|nr:IPTL-CTERM sorting domain-containing protein [Burkholderiales bacterium]MCA0311881.1 IPTL-CTERM sorting domain-containing protein [Pseudomonadota bacterium]
MRHPAGHAPSLRRAVIAVSLLVAATAHADYVVPAGATVGLGGGSIDLGCTDVIVDGTLDLQGGTLTNVRHVQIGAGGNLLLGGGSASLAGNWSNTGAFNAGTGAVNIIDDVACAPGSLVSGNTTFYALNISSNTGKLVQFVAGSTQTVQSSLTLTGTAANPLRIESTTPGLVSANIDLTTGGTQNLANLAVRGMGASGQWLAPGQTNQGAGPVNRWFGTPGGVAAIPTMSPWTLTGMALALGALAARQRRIRKNNPSGRKS